MTTQEIEKQINELRRQKDKIEGKALVAHLGKLPEMIGKTYVYRRNSYSCPLPGQYWDVYKRLVRVAIGESSAWLLFEQYEIDHEGKVSIETSIGLITSANIEYRDMSGWVECSLEEFERNRLLCMHQLGNPTKRESNLLSGGVSQ